MIAWNKGLKRWWNSSSEFKNGHVMSEKIKDKISNTCKKRKVGSWMKGRKFSKETKEKMKQRMLDHPIKYWFGKKGVEHIRWIKDRNDLVNNNERNDSMYQDWVKQIKKRDKECQLKDENCCGYLVVHHIKPWRDYPELRYKLLNGITLCQFHHPLRRMEERRLIPIFTKLVEVK